MSNINNNIPSLTVGGVIDDLSELYVDVINSGKDIWKKLASLPAPFLWGPPGVGKSDAIYQIAERVATLTGKKTHVTDVRVLLFSPVDLRGIPVPDENREFAKWLMPQIFNLDKSEEIINFLFLDELSAAPQSVQAAAYQITLNRCVGEHKLPDNTIIIAAGNRTTDRSVAFKMPNALANRLMHYEIDVDFNAWSKWAIKNDIHPLVLGFLAFNNSKLIDEEVPIDSVAFPTPRSWAFVSQILKVVSDTNIDKQFNKVAACIGIGTATEFWGYCKVYRKLPSVDDILSGKNVEYPKAPDVLHALVASLSTRIVRELAEETLTDDMLSNMCLYVSRFPMDYLVLLYKNVLGAEKMKQRLMLVPEFVNWKHKNEKALQLIGLY